MRQRYFIIAGIVIVSLAIFLGIVLSLLGRQVAKNNQEPDVSPTPTLSPLLYVTPSSPFPRIVSSIPSNNATGVSTATQIELQFDKFVSLSNLEISVYPELAVTPRMSGNRLSLEYQGVLQPGTSYEVIVFNKAARLGLGALNFSTAGTRTIDLPDTKVPDEIIEDTNNQLKQERPDVYLSNFTPYENELFSITSVYNPSGEGKFTFNVVLKGDSNDQSRQELVNWVIQAGLTQGQFEALTVTYQ